MIQVGQSAIATVTVTESNIAKTMKSGSLEVFATPAMCAYGRSGTSSGTTRIK